MKRTLRLILGDQLNEQHSWFNTRDEQVIYLMGEMRQETDYVVHHIQKILAFFGAMRKFANELKTKGHRVIYFKINDPENPQKLDLLLDQVIRTERIERFEYLLPDEYRLDQQLRAYCESLTLPSEAYDTQHFLSKRGDLKAFFAGKKQYLMESFYRMMRRKHQILMAGPQPEGGKWNFDHSNRNKWKGDPPIPEAYLPKNNDLSALLQEIEQAGIETLGTVDATAFPWPLSRKEALDSLDYFCKNLLPHFGDFQDAMHTGQAFLFHSRLSFSMNVKLLGPAEVIEKVLETWHENREVIEISQVEGFIRQILGWREYMRGMYWAKMPEYQQLNALENHNKLPDFFWTADTKMNCLKHAIKNSLDNAYAHHIQRLMITGNFALLAMIHPDQVDRWYLGIYIDALQWVEITNTRGMSQFADGGLIATKPYVSSANYINKMGNYCTGCHYDSKKKIGEKACPFNALYWNFLAEKREHFEKNPRMGMMLRLLDKKDPSELNALKKRAAAIVKDPDNF